MRNLILAAGVAALAIAAPAASEPRGKGGDKKSQSAKAERGGGGERARGGRVERRAERRDNRQAQRSREKRAERQSQRRTVQTRSAARAEQQSERRAERNRQARAERSRDARAERSRDARAERQSQRRAERQADRVQERRADARRDRRLERARAENIRDRRQQLRDREGRVAQRFDRDDYRYRDYDGDRRRTSRALNFAYLDGCPPGLAKQNELCMPPGQYRKLVGQRLPARYSSYQLPRDLRDYYRETDDYYYRYGDGYLYRVSREDQLVRAILPLLGAGLGVGMTFPYSSPDYYVPTTYQSFYQDNPYSYYRYADGYVYEIDRGSGYIEDVIPLLDHGYGVGQMLPSSYSYYNLPDPYRSYYQDDDDYYYRYAPGAIYQVDRQSQLITAVASLLMGGSNGLAVGQPLPMGYDMYNVPMDYRDRYYDTPDSWYRYANGNIYQVDPTTRLITAIVDAIV